MTEDTIRCLLDAVRDGRTTNDEALKQLRRLPFEDLGYAKVDHHRAMRTGMPEVIYATGKTGAEVAEIFAAMACGGGNVLATRANDEKFNAVRQMVPDAIYHPR